jgi:hypothetical protein
MSGFLLPGFLFKLSPVVVRVKRIQRYYRKKIAFFIQYIFLAVISPYNRGFPVEISDRVGGTTIPFLLLEQTISGLRNLGGGVLPGQYMTTLCDHCRPWALSPSLIGLREKVLVNIFLIVFHEISDRNSFAVIL